MFDVQGNTLEIAGTALTALGSAWGVVKWIISQIERVRSEATHLVADARHDMTEAVEHQAQVESKLRHALAGNTMACISALQRDVTALEGRFEARTDRLGNKLDDLSDRLGELGVVSAMVRDNTGRLERLLGQAQQPTTVGGGAPRLLAVAAGAP